MKRAANRARKFCVNTCPSSRHLHIMADALLSKRQGYRYSMFEDEPEHCAQSILAVLISLWQTRTLLDKTRKELDALKGKSKP